MGHLSWQSMFAADFKSKRKISVSPRLDAWDVMVITWTPKVCKIMAFMAVIMGLGLLFYILLGSR